MAVLNNLKQDEHNEVNFKRNVESNEAKRKGERYSKKLSLTLFHVKTMIQ